MGSKTNDSGAVCNCVHNDVCKRSRSEMRQVGGMSTCRDICKLSKPVHNTVVDSPVQ